METGCDRADLIPKPERLRSKRRRRCERLERRLASLLHAADQVLHVPAVCAGDRVGPPHDLESRRRARPLECGNGEWNCLLHRRESRLVVVADALVLGAIVEIVAEDEAALRIEIRAALRHEAEHLVGRKDAVLDLRAAGERGGLHALGAVGVHDRAQPLRFRLAADRIELVLRQCRRAAVANALRREDLDQVRALGLALPNDRAHRVGCESWAADRLQRRDNARARHTAGGDEVAQISVFRRAGTLNRGDAGEQGRAGVGDHGQHRLHGRVAVARRVEASAPIEVPARMGVRIDESRQDGVA